MDPREKARTKYHQQRDPNYGLGQDAKIANLEGAVTKARGQTSQGLSREARNQQRRQLAILGDQALHSDLLSFNQLKVSISTPISLFDQMQGKGVLTNWC